MNTPVEKTAGKGVWGQFFRILRQIRLDWPLILLSMVVGIVYYDVVTLIPGSTAALMAGDFSTAAIMSVVLVFVGQTALNVITGIVELFATSRSVRGAQQTVWKRMMGVQTGFFSDNTPEQLLSAVTSDVQSAVDGIVSLVASTIPSFYYMLKSFRMVSGYNPKLLFSLFAMVPVFVLYAVFIGKWRFNTNFRIQTRIGALTGYLSERLRNLGLIKSYVTEEQEDTNGQGTIKRLYKARLHTQYINAVDTGYLMITEAISVAIAVVLASVLMRNGELELEGWLAFYMFLPGINGCLRRTAAIWSDVKNIQGYCVRIGRILDAPQEKLDQGTKPVAGDIAFQDVSFAYKEEPVLEHVNFTAPAGKVTAIVGLSGSGKSTMLNLLERFYSPTSGKITMGGQDIAGTELSAFRRTFAYVPQDAGVFSGSFRDILTYGVEQTVSDQDLIRVTELAGIRDFIEAQPGGFNAKVAIWGASLSGGQRQRLVIAREILKNADVLLFDEPTSSLDPQTAAEIQQAILHTFQGKTILMVSHDLRLVGAADQIIVVDQGTVQAVGTHADLMKRCDLYRELVEEQAYQEVFAQ